MEALAVPDKSIETVLVVFDEGIERSVTALRIPWSLEVPDGLYDPVSSPPSLVQLDG
jgi:hypothetical protein